MMIDLLKDDDAYFSVVIQSDDAQHRFENLSKLDNSTAFLIEVEKDSEFTFSYQGKNYVILYYWTEKYPSGTMEKQYLIGLPDDVRSISNELMFLNHLDDVMSFELENGIMIRFIFKGQRNAN